MMMYESPITIIQDRMRMQMEDDICKAVQHFSIDVNKEELIKALAYDRDQYQKGYSDRDQEIVRCKDCKWYDERISICNNCYLPREQTFFCADGKRKEGR